jgi:branched-chain amino acid aminotransferase
VSWSTIRAMPAFVNVNGRITDAASAVIPVYDHGFLYGEGVYEVFRTYGGQPFLFGPHMTRLRASAARIHLNVPLSDDDILGRSLATMSAASLGPGRGEAYVRLMLTRGVGEITYDPAACPEPSLVIIAKPLPVTPDATYETGTRVVMVEQVVRNHPDSVSPLIKSNNLINNALGMQQAIRANAAEAVFRNYRGELAECAQSNLFIVKAGIVKTPPLEAGLLAGITRGFVLDLGRSMGIPVEEVTLFDRDLFAADEAFFTSTTKEIVPIVEVGAEAGHRVVGSGVPGPTTTKLLTEYRRRALAR